MASVAEQMASNISLGSFAKATDLKKRLWFTLGALIIFRLLSFVPLTFLALSLLGLVGRADESSFLVLEIKHALPETPIEDIVRLVRTVQDNAWSLGIVGGAFLLWTSLSLFSALESAFIGGTLEDLPDAYRDASPITYADRAHPPVLMINGGRDFVIERRVAQRLRSRLAGSGLVIFLELPWAGHAFDTVPFGPGGQVELTAVERFVATMTSPP